MSATLSLYNDADRYPALKLGDTQVLCG